MNYQEARKLSDGSGWHMTIRNDDRIWTHSCCREQVPATEDDVARLDWIYHGSLKVGDLIDGDPHEPHATREGAEQHYHAWRLRRIEETLEFDDAISGDWTGCEAQIQIADRPEGFTKCDKPTKGGARYRDDHHPETLALCPDHRDQEIVLGLIGRVTSSIYS